METTVSTVLLKYWFTYRCL